MFRPLGRAAAAALVLGVLAAYGRAAEGPALANPSFEGADEVLSGWETGTGARTANAGPASEAALDRAVARDGRSSLRLSGDGSTAEWRMLTQAVPVSGGDRVVFRVAARARGVAPAPGQYENANALLLFEDAGGRRLGLLASPVLRGDRDWVDLAVQAIAPAGAVRARVGVFLSMSGTVWFDDARLAVAPTAPLDRAARESAADALRLHLEQTYPFFGVAGRPSAEALFRTHREAVVAAKDRDGLLSALERLLADLGDVHVFLESPEGRRFPCGPSAAPPNWDLAAIRARLDETTAAERNLLAGRIGTGADAVGYVLIGSFALDEGQVARLEQALDALSDARALVLDVRPNGGGDERAAARVAGRFTAEPVVYAAHRFRDPTLPGTDGFGPTQQRVLAPRRPGELDPRPVVVLQGPHCVSSTEGFLLMARALPTVTTVGLPSRGASGNPAPFELLPDLTVWSSRWQSLLPDGTLLEGAGVPPEVRTDQPPPGREPHDAALARALELLAR